MGLLIFLSCTNKPESDLEITFTSKNNNTINILKSVYFTRINSINHVRTKPQSFHNIKCVVPNKFFVQPIDTRLYIGLIQIETNNRAFYRTFDSILISSGTNRITEEINLGSVLVPTDI